jgi:hypothetical protein
MRHSKSATGKSLSLDPLMLVMHTSVATGEKRVKTKQFCHVDSF